MNLQPLRASLLARAQAQADSIIGAAKREADERRAAARAEAEGLLGRAAADREAAAGAARARRLLSARRQAQTIVLQARRDAYDELRAAAQAATANLRVQPAYARLRERLGEVAREQVGAEADLVDPPGGGVVASAGERLVDYSLPAMTDRCLAELGPELEELWR
jgi:vacuolar-type H+-ATPase subunit E/Vma4